MRYLALFLALLALPVVAADQPVESDPRLHSDGQGWKLNQATIQDPQRPRVLLIGDSILSGYMNQAIKALQGKAYVDAWVNPYCQSEHLNNKILPAVLAKGPYDVIHFNMGLHGWPEGRIKPGTFEPLTKGYVEVIRKTLPRAKIIWASSTPVLLEGEVKQLDPVINANILEQNRLAAKVMAEMNVPVNDFYALLVDKLELARGGNDKFHWNPPAYQILGDQCVAAVLKALAETRSAAVAKPRAAVPPEFVSIVDDPRLPRVLLMGDSVSIAYALEVRTLLAGAANVHRVPANCGSTKVALGSYGLLRWLPDPQEKWDVIHFNHGLHDLSYRFADDRDKNDQGEYATRTNGGHQNVPPADYEKNLRQVITRLKQTGAKLIFASTTPVPECDAAKYVQDAELPYNEVARRVMNDEGVAWNDLWGLVKPRQAELQGKRNVHFLPTGSSVMAKQVAEAIRKQLPQRPTR